MERALVYLVAILMGCIVGVNGYVERFSRSAIGRGYGNRTWASLSALGNLSWLCLFPAAYFIGSATEGTLWQGLLFFVVAFVGGGLLSGWVRRMHPLNYLISGLALPANALLTALVYVVTK